jgi:hypothetical protein
MSDDFELSTGLPSSDMEAYLQLFLDETSEQLDGLVDALLLIEQEPDNGPAGEWGWTLSRRASPD